MREIKTITSNICDITNLLILATEFMSAKYIYIYTYSKKIIDSKIYFEIPLYFLNVSQWIQTTNGGIITVKPKVVNISAKIYRNYLNIPV